MVKKPLFLIGAVALVLLLVATLALKHHNADADEASGNRVVISCAATGLELELCKEGASEWSRQTGIPTLVVSAPNSASERLGSYILLLAAKSPDIDIFAIDTTWAGIIGDFFIDLKDHTRDDILQAQFSQFVDNNTVGDRLVALPWFIDAGILYYRKDLLEKYDEQPPQTWEDLTRTAEHIQEKERTQGNDKLWGFVFQGRAYEGLTCNALEWIASYNGGTIVDAKGTVTIENPNAEKALQLAASWVNHISPPGVLNYTEEESRGVFQSGNAVFMRNWPYAWKLANGEDSPVRDKVGVTLLPKGSPVDGTEGQHAATLGGWSLAVSKFSRHQKQAVDLALYLTSAKEQKRRFLKGGFQPTVKDLYKDAELLKANPFLRQLVSVFESATLRPARSVKTRYNPVSVEFFEAVHSVLEKEQAPRQALQKLKSRLENIGRNGTW